MTTKARSKRLRRLFLSRQTQAHWTELLKRRSTAAFVLGTLVWLLIFLRLFYFQVLKATEYKKIATKQHQFRIKLDAKRGIIYDRNGKELVINLPVESFFAIPESVKNVDLVARSFVNSSNFGFSQLKQDLCSQKNFVWLKRKVEKEESQKIKQRKLAGVWAKNETKRYHLYGDLAEEMLGFTDIDNKGLAGVEYQYDTTLRGKEGEAVFQRDGHQNYYQITEFPIAKPQEGKSLVLTIDIELQSIVEQELREGIDSTGADGGYAIFMHPKTGEILAMAYCGKDDGLPMKNRTISDCFEPGSTFKLITASAALEEKLFDPGDKIFAENGKFRIGKKIIHDVHPYGWLTFKECVMYSSNIALGKIAMRLGKEKIYHYARNFGVGEKTGIDLPGEGTGSIPSVRISWPDVALANIGFGQGVSLTALQIACAYSAVANDGILMKPFVVRAILDERGDTLQSFSPTPVRRVVSENTAHLLVDFMKGVVSVGSGKRAKIEGLDVAGKTGTAQKAKLGGRGYEENSYIASFIGFFPADDPQMVGLITLDSPKRAHLGGSTAAPVFKNATQRIVSLNGESILASVAKNILTTAMAEFPPNFIEKNLPGPEQPRLGFLNSKRYELFFKPDTTSIQDSLIPDVRGKTTREAVRILTLKDLKFKVRGSGIVVNQIYEPDSCVNKDSLYVIIECQPL
jgi:cell division protein FtsI (penicillin-binding protein 3)